jgi:hypothetical protein
MLSNDSSLSHDDRAVAVNQRPPETLSLKNNMARSYGTVTELNLLRLTSREDQFPRLSPKDQCSRGSYPPDVSPGCSFISVEISTVFVIP